MIILGIDPGTEQMGYCIYDTDNGIIATGAIKTSDWKKNGTFNLLLQAHQFANSMNNMDVVWIERTFVGVGRMYSPILVVMTNIMYEVFKNKTKTEYVEVKKWRKLVFNQGNITKDKVISTIKKHYNKDYAKDEAEAIGIALAGNIAYGGRNPLNDTRTSNKRLSRKSTK